MRLHLARYGYNVKALSELLNIRQAEVRAFLHGQLSPGRTEELHNQLLAAGIPLSDRLSRAENHSVTGSDREVALCCAAIRGAVEAVSLAACHAQRM